MPLTLGPGHAFDVLGHHVENCRGRLRLVIGLRLSLSARGSSRASLLAFHLRSPPSVRACVVLMLARGPCLGCARSGSR